MQISGKTESSFRRFNSYISSIVFVLIGIAFLIFTFMSFTTPQSDLVETTAEIVDVVKGATSDDESYVIINYATEDGTRYENVRYDAYSSGWKTGKEIKIMFYRSPFLTGQFAPSIFVLNFSLYISLVD